MAGPTEFDSVRAAWRALAGNGQNGGWNTIPVGVDAPCVIHAGRHSPGNEEAILVGFERVRPPPQSHLPQGHGFQVSRLDADPLGGSRMWLALSRRATGSLDLFAMMVDDIVRLLKCCATGQEERALQQFLARIRAWQDFMERHRDGVLGPEAELGLVGEILLLEAMVAAGVPTLNAIEAWQGPLDGLHDFIIGTGGIEVKTSLATAGFRARIASLDQLDESLRQPLFLGAVRLSLDPAGKTLPEIADEVRSGLPDGTLVAFETRLMQAGLLPATEARYQRRFTHVATGIYTVEGTFPRLTRSSVGVGVVDAAYDIELSSIAGQEVPLPAAIERLGGI